MPSESTQVALARLAAILAADSDSDLKSNRIARPILTPGKGCEGWAMRMHDAFLDALDVKQTARTVSGVTNMEWTSGSWFNFTTGDIVHENSATPRFLWQVDSARPAAPRQTLRGVEISPRSPGEVRFSIYDSTVFPHVKTGCITVTQDEFVRLLIEGRSLT